MGATSNRVARHEAYRPADGSHGLVHSRYIIASRSDGLSRHPWPACRDAQLRLVDYSAGYTADHWCHKGHVVLVIAGTLTIAHEDGRSYELARADGLPCVRQRGFPASRDVADGASVFISTEKKEPAPRSGAGSACQTALA
jgi:hypothetical protein